MKAHRILTWPLSLIWGAILRLRHAAYDVGVLRSERPSIPTVAVGNLAFGGTGKTPHVLWLANQFVHKDPAVISRGHGRETRDMRFVKRTDRADQVGDEPLLTRHKLAESSNVVVSRSRLEAIKELQESVPPGLIILDDALQHRQVNAHVTILLTTHDQPYSDDCLVPCGYLRDLKSRAGAAQIIIVTKCPADVIPDNSQWRRKLQLTDDQSLYFSRYLTGPPIELTSEFDGGRVSIPADAPIVVISGIAQNADFAAYVKQHHDHVAEAGFKDHHGFTATDIATTLGKFPNFAGGQKWLVTTEKDAVRLLPFLDQLKKENVRVAMLPIQVQIIGSETELINELKQYVG